ncbi:MAG TPA: YciI family protein [Ktedonobacterales bacterium]|nr:YciI family protein [Ktedonobacterales bacterium]
MRYALLIYTDEAQDAQATKEDWDAMTAAYNAFGEQFKEQIQGGEALMPTSSATTVRVRDGKALTTDGPFAETKEQLGGFYIAKAANLDEAINIASHIPGAKLGSIEVRPIMEFGEE